MIDEFSFYTANNISSRIRSMFEMFLVLVHYGTDNGGLQVQEAEQWDLEL